MVQRVRFVHKWKVIYDEDGTMYLRFYENDNNGCTCIDKFSDIPLLDIFLQVCALHY